MIGGTSRDRSNPGNSISIKIYWELLLAFIRIGISSYHRLPFSIFARYSRFESRNNEMLIGLEDWQFPGDC
jgi:hypothetical protein